MVNLSCRPTTKERLSEIAYINQGIQYIYITILLALSLVKEYKSVREAARCLKAGTRTISPNFNIYVSGTKIFRGK